MTIFFKGPKICTQKSDSWKYFYSIGKFSDGFLIVRIFAFEDMKHQLNRQF